MRRILPGLVSLIHEAGCLVVMEGLETAEHSMIAMESDVDFVQGYYFGEPRSCLSTDEDYRGVLNELFQCFQERVRRQSSSERSVLAHYSKKFEGAAELLRSVANRSMRLQNSWHWAACSAATCCRPKACRSAATSVPAKRRAGSIRATSHAPTPRAPIGSAGRTSAARLPQPLAVQISRPYLSIADARACVTFSIAIPETDGVRVVCADWTGILRELSAHFRLKNSRARRLGMKK
ncbi:MAG: EAL domain-containing protein [Pseudomonadota bacterium]